MNEAEVISGLDYSLAGGFFKILSGFLRVVLYADTFYVRDPEVILSSGCPRSAAF